MSPHRPCNHHRCPLFAAPRRSYCPEHQRAEWRLQNARRPVAIRQFYDGPAWRQLRAAYLAEHPICEDCATKGLGTPAAQVDHVLPLRDRPDLALDPSNLRALCKGCHSSKTLTDRHREGRPGGSKSP